MDATDLPHLEGVTHRWVDLPGLRMHVAEAGVGEPVLLLHGFPQHWWEWRHVMGPLAARHHVIAPDLRGAGWTRTTEGDLDPVQLVDDVLALLDALGLDSVDLVAHDYSAFTAYRLCLRPPHPGATPPVPGTAPVPPVPPADAGRGALPVVPAGDRDTRARSLGTET